MFASMTPEAWKVLEIVAQLYAGRRIEETIRNADGIGCSSNAHQLREVAMQDFNRLASLLKKPENTRF